MTPSLELGWKKIHGERSARCPAACPRLAYEAPQRGSISVADSIEQIGVARLRAKSLRMRGVRTNENGLERIP
jgi:hypothetical protein